MAVDITHWADREIDPTIEPWYRFGRVIDAVEKYGKLKPDARWLDLGCQWGEFLCAARKRFSIKAHGIDDFPQENAVEVYKRFSKNTIDPNVVYDGDWTYHDRRLHKTGIALDEKFDIISALEIIEHMVDTDEFLKECNRHLVVGGILVVTTPNINSLRNRVLTPFGVYPAGMEHRNIIHHVRLYNAPLLKSHAQEHGFELIHMAGVSFLRQKMLKNPIARTVDTFLSDRFPSLCGNLLAVFRKESE